MRPAGSELPPRRASDADRERAVNVLREAAVDGRLSHDSFVQRVDRALKARNEQALAALVADLTPQHMTTRLFESVASLTERLRPHATYPPLGLPGASAPVLVIGRQRDCGFMINDDMVSRVHAALMLYAGRWYVTDRGSTNGTHVNGRRIWGTAAIRPGDRLTIGRTTFRLVPPVLTRTWPD